jgi:CRISPR-associated endonuclease/helicase Cas3
VADKFDEMFDGTEAILISDQNDYHAALTAADGRAAGRLLAEEYLIPMPSWAAGMARYDRTLGVQVVDGEYDPDRGLLAVHGPAALAYRPGEVL